MLTVEASFCQEMKALWATGVAVTVQSPDERWVATGSGARAAVIATDWEIRTGAGSTSPRPSPQGGEGAYRRKRGKCQFALEVRIKTENAAEELLALCDAFVEQFHLGYTFDEFQINGPLRGARVRTTRGGPRITEMVIVVPAAGPFEVSETRYDVDTVTDEVETEGSTEVQTIQAEGD